MAADLGRVRIWHVFWLFRGLLFWLCVVDLVVDVKGELLLLVLITIIIINAKMETAKKKYLKK